MRKQRGAITLITLATILLMLAFLISTFTIIMNRRQAQSEVKRKTKEIYESDVGNEEELYNNYFADTSEVIPITTVEQLLKVGTDEYIESNGIIYKCTVAASYRLDAELELIDSEYLDKYPNQFGEQTWTETEYQDASEEVKIGTYTGAAETFTVTKDGKYLLEVWGANGGTYNNAGEPGTGGYSKGTVELYKNETISLYVGGKGKYGTGTNYTETSGGGFNGGGNAGYRGGAGRRWH